MLPIEYWSAYEHTNKFILNVKCLSINILGQTMEGLPLNIAVKNIDPDGQAKISIEKGTDYYFPFHFSVELKGEYGEVEFHLPQEIKENKNDKE